MALKLHDCKSASEYAGKFKELHNDIVNMYDQSALNESFLIFLFHRGLGKEHEDYVLQYTESHAAFDSEGRIAFTLDYAIQRFISRH